MNKDFLTYQAQTSAHPLLLEIKRARGSYVFDKNDKKYLDFIAGVSANTLGHHPKPVIKAIKQQLDKYMHVMVYGNSFKSRRWNWPGSSPNIYRKSSIAPI